MSETSAESPPRGGWSSLSASGRHRVRIEPVSGRVELGRLQVWRARFETRDGRSFLPGGVLLSGSMPQHGHGLDTAPRAAAASADGEVQIEGVRFHMAGSWRLRVDFVGPVGPDYALFEIRVEHGSR